MIDIAWRQYDIIVYITSINAFTTTIQTHSFDKECFILEANNFLCGGVTDQINVEGNKYPLHT